MVECMFLCLTYRDATSVVRIIPICRNVIENVCSKTVSFFRFESADLFRFFHPKTEEFRFR